MGLNFFPRRIEIFTDVSISTAGVAEIRMATSHPERHIIATTIDGVGVEFAKSR